MKQEYAQFETLGGKGKSKAKEALIFTPSKPLMKVMPSDASAMPHTVHGMMLTKYSSHVIEWQPWMLADVHLLCCTIMIYDSHLSRSGWAKIKKQLAHMHFLIPQLLKETGFQIARSNLKLTSKAMDKPFEIQTRANYGQQNNSANCRVFLLKFAYYISSGLDIDHTQHESMPFFILKLAIEFIRGRAFSESLCGHHLFQYFYCYNQRIELPFKS
ncbi:hypothetical protein PS2_025333 [Malus domestica]